MLLFLALASLVAAQPVSGTSEVERITLAPGDAVVFTITAGTDHQILNVRAEGADAKRGALRDGEVRLRFAYDGKQSTLFMENGLDHPLTFDALGDRDGNGGFRPLGEATVPAGTRAVVGSWTFPIAALNIGHFEQAPHGRRTHR